MKYQKPKGTADILPGESEVWQMVENTAAYIFSRYRFSEIRTPMFESYEVFQRSSGETSDIVSKEMYDFYDKGDRHIALRPEGTAGVVRAYVENKLYAPEIPQPVKVWYKGPMFRYERPQSGRQRQFHQIGVEVFGSDSYQTDVETISMAIEFLSQLNINDYKLEINSLGDKESREKYHEALINYLTPLKEQLSEDSQDRLEKNPLRILDSKDAKDQEIVKDAPSILDYLNEDSQKHFDDVKNLLDDLGIQYTVNSNMVRGLDYYNHTIFEIMVTSPAFDNKEMTVIAGGRYNGLVEELGGPSTPGFGFGLGVERLISLLNKEVLAINQNSLDVFIVGVSDDVQDEVFKLMQRLRESGLKVDKDFLGKKTKGQFKMADNLNSKIVLTIGESEIEEQVVSLKNMKTGEQEKVPFGDLEKSIKMMLREK